MEDAPAAPAEKPTKAPEKAPEKPAEKAAEKPAEQPKGIDPVLPTFQTPKQLRDWAKSRDAAARQMETEKQRLEARVKELEGVVPRSQQDAALLTQKIAEYEKTITQYEQVLATHVFEHSPKFQKEFQQPYAEARQRAYRQMAELSVREDRGEKDDEGKTVYHEREATQADFDYIYGLPARQARAEAKKMFGEDASVVLASRERVAELAEKAIAAREEHQKSYKEQMQQAQATEASKRNMTDQLWRRVNDAISADPKRQEDWGTPQDPEAAKALADGFNLANYFFSEDRDKMSPEDKVAFDANVRHRIAGFSLQRHLVRQLKARNAELEAEIATLRGSQPGKPTPTPETAEKPSKDVLQLIDEL